MCSSDKSKFILYNLRCEYIYLISQNVKIEQNHTCLIFFSMAEVENPGKKSMVATIPPFD